LTDLHRAIVALGALVKGLIVTDVFGVRTFIRSAGQDERLLAREFTASYDEMSRRSGFAA
jgi:hypothetical protein